MAERGQGPDFIEALARGLHVLRIFSADLAPSSPPQSAVDSALLYVDLGAVAAARWVLENLSGSSRGG